MPVCERNHFQLSQARALIVIPVLICIAALTDRAPAAAQVYDANPDLTTEQQQLWDMRVIRQSPLNPEIRRLPGADGYAVEQLFFDSEQTTDGPNRVFCGVSYPTTHTAPLPILLELHGGGGHGSTDRALQMARNSNAFVMSLDWGGKTSETETALRTLWRGPRSADATASGANSLAHRVVVACMRAIDYAQTRRDVNPGKVMVYGGSWGSFYSMLVSGIDPRITDTIALIGAGGWADGFDICAYGVQLMPPADRAAWLRTYDPLAYAGTSRANTSLVAYANDSYFAYDGVQQNYLALTGPKRLINTPNSDHGIATVPDAIVVSPVAETLLEYHLQGGSFPSVVEHSLREDTPGVFEWQTAGAEVTSASLCFSPGRVYWRSRYWITIPARREGAGWRAELPEYCLYDRGEYFITVNGPNGRNASSLTHLRGGGDPLVELCEPWPVNPLWDQPTGILAWRPSIYHKTIRLEDAGPGAVQIIPSPEDNEFDVLTNSVVLLGKRAAEFAGIHLELDAGAEPGKLNIELRRDGDRMNKPYVYSVTVTYQGGVNSFDLPWSRFAAGPDTPPEPIPFDTLAFTGKRENQTPIKIQSVTLLSGKTATTASTAQSNQP